MESSHTVRATGGGINLTRAVSQLQRARLCRPRRLRLDPSAGRQNNASTKPGGADRDDA